MTARSSTRARTNLSSWLKRAVQDEDYAQREYGVTEAELDAFVKRTDAEIKRERKAGQLRRYAGNLISPTP